MEAGTRVGAPRTDSIRQRGVVRRLTTETKQAFKTTEFWAMLGVIAAILVSAAAIKGGDTSGTDEFIARQAWLYVAIVAGAYLISRGLAKSGSSDPYTDSDGDSTNGSRQLAPRERCGRPNGTRRSLYRPGRDPAGLGRAATGSERARLAETNRHIDERQPI